MKLYKKEENGVLEVGQVLYTRSFILKLDRKLCKGCELCKIVCPREAISLVPVTGEDGNISTSHVDIDETKCDFHGICAAICPFSAIRITVGGVSGYPVVSKEAFPVLTRDIKVQSEKCETGCKICEETCPLGIISVTEKESGTEVEIQKHLCASCGICWMECPEDAINVTKFIEGVISVQPGNCSDGCRNCVDACPVDALDIDENGKVYAKNIYCIYCGACLPVCPVNDALSIERTAVHHSPVESGAWNRGLEKITSSEGLARELAAKRSIKAQERISEMNDNPQGER